MKSENLKGIAEAIADYLFHEGFTNREASRLVLEIDGNVCKQSSGWCKAAIVNVINDHLAKTALLSRLRKAEKLLQMAHPGMHTCETSQWFTERDAWLKNIPAKPKKSGKHK